MTEFSRPPWTPEQVRSLNGYQGEARMHPFTCGREHGDYTPLLEATAAGWVCNWKGCDYTQDWAHEWMTDWSWRSFAPPGLYGRPGCAPSAFRPPRLVGKDPLAYDPGRDAGAPRYMPAGSTDD